MYEWLREPKKRCAESVQSVYILVLGDKSGYPVGDVLQELKIAGVRSPDNVAEYNEERAKRVREYGPGAVSLDLNMVRSKTE